MIENARGAAPFDRGRRAGLNGNLKRDNPIDPPTQTFSVPVSESIKVDGKFVRLKRLPSGDLSISVDKSETMLRKVIEPLARASGSGWYDYDHQNWLVPVRNAAGARQKLIALSQRKHTNASHTI